MTAYELTDSTPSVNQERLNELRVLLGEDFEQVLSIYREDTEQRLEQLAVAIAGGDIAQVENIAHALKSASANIALERMSAWSSKLEQAGRNGGLAAAGDILAELRQEYLAIQPLLSAPPA